MVAEWSAECSAEDAVLVVPWHDPEGTSAFVDLRTNPYDFDRLPEAEQYPPLMQALRALNAPRSPVFSAKCDAWTMVPEDLETMRIGLDLPTLDAAEMRAGFASYIDLIWRERAVFASFHQQEQQMHRLTRLASPLDHPYAALECVLRPAFVDLAGPQEGFAVSLYVKALGTDAESARQNWSVALESVVSLMRSRDFAAG
jgi:hypothetical protein